MDDIAALFLVVFSTLSGIAGTAMYGRKSVQTTREDLVDAVNALRRLDGTAKDGLLGVNDKGRIKADFFR